MRPTHRDRVDHVGVEHARAYSARFRQRSWRADIDQLAEIAGELARLADTFADDMRRVAGNTTDQAVTDARKTLLRIRQLSDDGRLSLLSVRYGTHGYTSRSTGRKADGKGMWGEVDHANE